MKRKETLREFWTLCNGREPRPEQFIHFSTDEERRVVWGLHQSSTEECNPVWVEISVEKMEGPPQGYDLGNGSWRLKWPAVRTWVHFDTAEMVDEIVRGYYKEDILSQEDISRDADYCGYCGTDNTGCRQGWDCWWCGGN